MVQEQHAVPHFVLKLAQSGEEPHVQVVLRVKAKRRFYVATREPQLASDQPHRHPRTGRLP